MLRLKQQSEVSRTLWKHFETNWQQFQSPLCALNCHKSGIIRLKLNYFHSKVIEWKVLVLEKQQKNFALSGFKFMSCSRARELWPPLSENSLQFILIHENYQQKKFTKVFLESSRLVVERMKNLSPPFSLSFKLIEAPTFLSNQKWKLN